MQSKINKVKINVSYMKKRLKSGSLAAQTVLQKMYQNKKT